MQDKSLAECARFAQACELSFPGGDQEAVRFGALFSPEAECSQHKLMLLPACLWGSLGTGLGWVTGHPGAVGGTCSWGR